MTTLTAPQMLKYRCGLCSAGRHDLCPGAIWNPGSGEIVTPAIGSIPAVHAGELRYCPCDSTEHTETLVRCRNCGTRNPLGASTDKGTCTDTEGCATMAAVRQENDPTFQLVRECQTTVIVSGEVKERPRRAKPEERAKAKVARQEAKARACVCNCGGTTKGGLFLPGHDARYVSQLAKGIHDAPNAKVRKQRIKDALEVAMAECSEALKAKLRRKLDA